MATKATPQESIDTVLQMIRQWNGQAVDEILAVDEGQISQAFKFRQGQAWFIIRLSYGSWAYWRDRYAFETLAGPTGLPIPRVYGIGQHQGITFAISEGLPGTTLARLPAETVHALMGSILNQLQGLQKAHPPDPGRFGTFGPDRAPVALDWRTGLELFFSQPMSGYWQGWHSLFNHDWFQAKTFWPMHKRMLELAAYAPPTAYVVHGDFHCGNMLGEGQAITGLIDWAQMLFGDWVYDVATFQLWSPQFDLARMVLERGRDRGFDLSHFQERFWCSCYAVGLDALRFDAKIGDETAGRQVLEKLETMEQASWARF
jgi:hygromycin-B 4-O-kinase